MNKTTAKSVLTDLLYAYAADEYGDYFYDHGDVVCEAVKCILREQPRWISVKDALPEVGEMVLACYINPLRKDRPPRMMVGMNPQFSNNKIYLWCGGWRAITHWMPLPTPPEVEV